MDWGDVLIIALLAAGVWTFVPRHVRFNVRSIVSPLLRTLLDTLHEGASVARKAITHIAYRGLLGVPVPDRIMGTSKEVENGKYEAEPEPLRSCDFPLPNGVEPQTNRSTNLEELQLNATEMAALQHMIVHNKTAAKPSKSSTIQAGFGVSRGGSTAYQRASLIYDTLFGTPAPAVRYAQRTPEQDALRQHLGIAKH